MSDTRVDIPMLWKGKTYSLIHTRDLNSLVVGAVNGSARNLTVIDGLTADLAGTVATQAGAGITAGTGTVVKYAAQKSGDLKTVRIFIDLTGLNSAALLGSIIGVDETDDGCFLAALAASEMGTGLFGRMTCLEAPAGGEPDVDLYQATEATGVTGAEIGDLTETALLAAAADWTAGTVKEFSALPDDGGHLYLTVGTDSDPVAGTYTAGKFLIEIVGC